MRVFILGLWLTLDNGVHLLKVGVEFAETGSARTGSHQKSNHRQAELPARGGDV